MKGKMQAKITEYTNMKQEVEGEVRIGDVAEVKYGKAKPKTKGNIPVVGSSGIYDWTDKPLIEFPTIVVGRKGTAGEVHLFFNPCYPSDTTFYLKFFQNAPDLTYLFYYMRLNKLSGEHAKTTLPSLQKGDLENYKFPYPPLPEQWRIAKVLGAIQRAIEQQDKIIEAAKNLKKSLMQKLFTEGLGHIEFKETEIGDTPKSWKVVRLSDDDVADILMGQSPPSKTYNKDGVGLPFFQGKAEFGEIYPTLNKWCSNPIKIAKEKDILVSVRAPVGDVNVAPFECCIGRGLAAIRPKEGLDPFYLFYYLKTSKERLESEGGGTTFKAISKSVVRNFKIPLPSLPEQQEIARILSTVDKKIEVEERRKATFNELFKAMLHKLMIGEIRLKDIEV